MASRRRDGITGKNRQIGVTVAAAATGCSVVESGQRPRRTNRSTRWQRRDGDEIATARRRRDSC
ncbi:hypothetical protein ACLOJK_008749, partial [Asimina triloba]